MVSNRYFLSVVVGMLLLVSCVQAAPVTNGLVVYYDGNLSGNSLIDLSGNNNAGIATSVTTGTNSSTGANYVSFDGVSSKIDVANNAQTNITSPITMEYIGSIDEFKQRGMIIGKFDGNNNGWYMALSSTSPYNTIRTGIGTQDGVFHVYNSDSSIVAGQIYDIVITYDNTNAKVYINGQLAGSRSGWNSPASGCTNNITICSGTLPYLKGKMYAFRLYNRALTASEVTQNYQSDQWRYTPKAIPVANFTASPTSGNAPLTVQFNDTSTNSPTNWNWNFGDGQTSTDRNPIHTYSTNGTYTVSLNVSNAAGYNISTKSNLITVKKPVANKGELQLWAFDASEVSGIPNNIYTATKTPPDTSNVSLKYNPTLGSIDSTCWHNDYGETYITGAYPTVNENLTFTVGVDSNSEWSYGYIHTSVAYIGVRHVSNGNYEIVSYWTADNGSQLGSSFQISASSVVNNRVTVSIHSYDSNRTNVITSGPTLKITTPYTTQTTRNLPYPNVIQPLIYEDFWASGTGGWVNVHLYSITQSIPRDIITPYARNDIMGFGLDCPKADENHLCTDFLISHNQSATVFVSGTGSSDQNIIDYYEYLFSKGFEKGIHFYPGLASTSLASAKTIIDTQMEYVTSLFGAVPTSWSSHANDDNVTHAIYAYQRYGALYRTGYQGMGDYITGSANLQNSTWYGWWNISSAHGAVCPCFTHQTDIYPAPIYSIDPNLFRTFVTNLNSNGIDLVNFTEWYYSSMAQTAITNVLESDANHMKFQLNTRGGSPVNMNVQTVISPSYLYCNSVSIPFEQTFDGIHFMSVGNGTYTLTNTPLATSSITWSKPADITYGTVLSSTQLNATASVPGSFVYTPAAGTVLSAGTHTLHADFTPTDTANYTNATADVTINVSENPEPVLPVANFTANKTEGTTPLTVKFTDTSINSPTEWKWNFGDGNTSNDANPIHTYATAGKFIANLTVSNAGGTDTASKTITVTGPVLGSPKASFTATPRTGRVPLTVKFTDKSSNATSLMWDFGDKSAISTESNPSHTYKAAGFFTVKLTAINGNKSSVASNVIIAS